MWARVIYHKRFIRCPQTNSAIFYHDTVTWSDICFKYIHLNSVVRIWMHNQYAFPKPVILISAKANVSLTLLLWLPLGWCYPRCQVYPQPLTAHLDIWPNLVRNTFVVPVLGQASGCCTRSKSVDRNVQYSCLSPFCYFPSVGPEDVWHWWQVTLLSVSVYEEM